MRTHTFYLDTVPRFPQERFSCRLQVGRSSQGSVMGRPISPGAPITTALSLVGMTSWLQARAVRSSSSDQKPPGEACLGRHDGLTAGKRARLGAH